MIIEQRETIPPPAVERVPAAALPKGESQTAMLDMAIQLSMNRFIPLHCAHSVVHFQPRMRSRWRRVVNSACKQCRQCHFPVIDEEAELGALLDTQFRQRPDALILAGERNGRSISQLDQGIIKTAPQVLLLVGREGGFSDAESALLARCGVWNIALGSQVLPIETAALALLAAVNQFIGV